MPKQRIQIDIELDFEYDHIPEIESWLRGYFEEAEAITVTNIEVDE